MSSGIGTDYIKEPTFIPNVHAVKMSLNPDVKNKLKMFCHIDRGLLGNQHFLNNKLDDPTYLQRPW